VPLIENLPSGLWVDAGWIWGIMDVAILDGELYALSGGGGASWGRPESPNGVYRILGDGTWELVADLGGWLANNPPAVIPWDYDPGGSWFDLEAGAERLWVTEAVAGMVLTVTPAGDIELIADLSEGHLVPTGLALADDGTAYVGFETTVPYPDGGSKVVAISPDGTVTDQWTGLTAVTDVVLGPDGALYAAEMATDNLDEEPYLRPESGRIVRQTSPDTLEPVVTEVQYPVYLGFGPDGALYMDYPAFGPDAGEGQGALLRIDLAAGVPISLAGMTDLPSTCEGIPEPAPGETEGMGTDSDMGQAAAQSVAIANFAFDPVTIEAPAGTTVTWTNEDSAPHTATADGGAFDSGRLDQGGTFSFTFESAGTYAYHCDFHPGMQGTIVIT
jgi:plastocyanin